MAKTYTTVQGDMWDSVAYSQLGSTDYTDVLMSANTAYRDIFIFPAGVVLTIPDADIVESANSLLPPWKQVST